MAEAVERRFGLAVSHDLDNQVRAGGFDRLFGDVSSWAMLEITSNNRTRSHPT
jgi:hypothetical protein